MPVIFLPQIDALVFNTSSFISMHPALVHEIGSHAMAHVIYSFMKRSCHRRGLSRFQMRKILNARNRWFVDNIIMHHKRIHDYNRKIIIRDSKKRAIVNKQKFTEKYHSSIENNKEESKISTRSLFFDTQNYQENTKNDNANDHNSSFIIERLESRKKREKCKWLPIFGKHFNNDDKDD